MKYNIGLIEKDLIRGWCFDEKNINVPVTIELFINDKKVDEKIANLLRKSVYSKDIHPTGMVGFEFTVKDKRITSNSIIELKIKDNSLILNHDKAWHKFMHNLLFKSLDTTFEKRRLCIVHIGMHKTGSSSIQLNLSGTVNENFTYFDLGEKNHSIPIYSLFSVNKYKYHMHKRQGLTKNDIDNFNVDTINKFKKHLENNKNYNTFVISGEDISVLDIEGLCTFRNLLKHYFEDIKIVAYVRPPFSFIVSAVQQRIKNGTFNNFEKDLKNVFPNYRNRFEKFDTVFGKENVALHLFEKNNLIKNDIITDFLFKNNLKVKVKEKKFASTNESLSLEAISLIYIYNKLGIKPIESLKGNQSKKFFMSVLRKVGTTKFLLSKQLIQPVLDDKYEDISWIDKRMNMKISDSNIYKDSLNSITCEKDFHKVAKKSVAELQNCINKNNIIDMKKNYSIDDIIYILDQLYINRYKVLSCSEGKVPSH